MYRPQPSPSGFGSSGFGGGSFATAQLQPRAEDEPERDRERHHEPQLPPRQLDHSIPPKISAGSQLEVAGAPAEDSLEYSGNTEDRVNRSPRDLACPDRCLRNPTELDQ